MSVSNKLSLGLLFGGASQEHEVSLMSIQSIWNSVNSNRFETYAIYITRDGKWYLVEDFEGFINAPDNRDKYLAESRRIRFDPGNDGGLVLGTKYFKLPLDVIFPVLHGPFGEDGRIQGLLDLLNIPYVGSGVTSSGVSMDKEIMKTLFTAKDLPTPDFCVFPSGIVDAKSDEILTEVQNSVGFPCFVKPVALGSSVGISRLDESEHFQGALSEAAKYDDKIIIEEAILGVRELECSVLGNDQIRVAGPGEIVPAGSFYDYYSKYCDDETKLIIPAKVCKNIAEQMCQLAEEAFRSVFAKGMARVDFFYVESTGEILVNEINTIPGFTSRSMYPLLWNEEGIAFSRLIDELIDLALDGNDSPGN